MIVTDYDLAFCKHALYCIYDKLIDQSDTEYYCNVYGKDALFCYDCGYHISIVVYNGQIRFTIDQYLTDLLNQVYTNMKIHHYISYSQESLN